MPQGQKKLGKGRKAQGGNSKSDSIRKKRAGQTKKGGKPGNSLEVLEKKTH